MADINPKEKRLTPETAGSTVHNVLRHRTECGFSTYLRLFLNLDETVEPDGSGAAGEGHDGNRAETSLIYLEN